jgi:hypothetical protein
VGLVVVGLPQGRVVDLAVGLRDLVVQRPVEALGVARRLTRRVLVGEERVRIALVPELDEDDEDLVGVLPRELDVAALADLGDLRARRDLPLEEQLLRLGATR